MDGNDVLRAFADFLGAAAAWFAGAVIFWAIWNFVVPRVFGGTPSGAWGCMSFRPNGGGGSGSQGDAG